MPDAWNNKDERMYDAIQRHLVKQGRSKEQAQEIAARTVNKQRRQEGRTPQQRTQGTGNPKTVLEDRTVEELRNRARELRISGRSRMRKPELVRAIRSTQNGHS